MKKKISLLCSLPLFQERMRKECEGVYLSLHKFTKFYNPEIKRPNRNSTEIQIPTALITSSIFCQLTYQSMHLSFYQNIIKYRAGRNPAKCCNLYWKLHFQILRQSQMEAFPPIYFGLICFFETAFGVARLTFTSHSSLVTSSILGFHRHATMPDFGILQ